MTDEFDWSVFEELYPKEVEVVDRSVDQYCCKKCGGYLVFDGSTRICIECAEAYDDFITDKVSEEEYFKGFDRGFGSGSKLYSRSKNFIKCMKEALGIEMFMVPTDVQKKVEALMPTPTFENARLALKILDKPYPKKYNTHCQNIVNTALKRNPRMPYWLDSKLAGLYSQFEENYENILEGNKKKFPPFGYLMRKCIKLIEERYEMDLSEWYLYFRDVKQKRTRIRNDFIWIQLLERYNQFPLIY